MFIFIIAIALQHRRYDDTKVYMYYRLELCSSYNMEQYLDETNSWKTRELEKIVKYISQVCLNKNMLTNINVILVHTNICPESFSYLLRNFCNLIFR